MRRKTHRALILLAFLSVLSFLPVTVGAQEPACDDSVLDHARPLLLGRAKQFRFQKEQAEQEGTLKLGESFIALHPRSEVARRLWDFIGSLDLRHLVPMEAWLVPIKQTDFQEHWSQTGLLQYDNQTHTYYLYLGDKDNVIERPEILSDDACVKSGLDKRSNYQIKLVIRIPSDT